jgi:hypothetical protein
VNETSEEPGAQGAEPAQDGARPAALSTRDSLQSERRFFAVALWLCAAGAAILLLCPAAFNRRVLTLQNERAETEARRQFTRNGELERQRNALESDPSVIESEARRNGYGRAAEKPYPITAAEWKTARAHLTAEAGISSGAGAPAEPSAAGQAILPAIMLIILGTMAVLFFCDLKVPEPGVRR